MNVDTDAIRQRIELSEVGRPISEVKNNLTSIVAELSDEPVYINVRGVPRAAIVQVDQLLDLIARAEALELMQIAEEAERGEKLTLDELRTFLDRRRAERKAARTNRSEVA